MIRYALPLLMAAMPAAGQEGPSFDCARAETTAENLVCEDEGLARLDRRLASRYAAAVDAARSLDAGAAEAENQLRAEQRGWIKGRDDCWKAEDVRACVVQAYLRREGMLVATWMLDNPAEVIAWQCDGNSANEVVTWFYGTELPSVRIERGDSVDAGSLVPTASGARFEGGFGRYIWVKGEEATYREPDPGGTVYQCTRQE